MQKTTKSILFTLTSNAQLLKYQQSVVAQAHRAVAYSQDKLPGLVPLLRDSPFPVIRSRARYFEAILRARNGGMPRASGELEYLALTADSITRASSLLSLGYYACTAQDYEAARRFYHEASIFVSADFPLLSFRIMKSMATNSAMMGRHDEALRQFESTYSLARYVSRADPMGFYDWLNSYSLELGEVGRFDEGIAAARIVAGSIAARIHPTMSESLGEIIELRAFRQRSRNRAKPADLLDFQQKVNEIEYYRNKQQILHAAIDPELDPARAKLGADVTNIKKLAKENVAQVQEFVDRLGQSPLINRQPASIVKLEQSK